MKEPVSICRNLYQCLTTFAPVAWILRGIWDKLALASCTVCEENSTKIQCVYHCYESATLLEPVWTCAPQRCSKPHDPIWESLSITTNHLPKFLYCEQCVQGVLTYIDVACLECTPPYICVWCKVTKHGYLAKWPSLYIMECLKYASMVTLWIHGTAKSASPMGKSVGKARVI